MKGFDKMGKKKELAAITKELIGKELSIKDTWTYLIIAQILLDICDGYEDSMTAVSSKLNNKEVEEILEFLRSVGFTCKIKRSENDNHTLVFYTYWGEEEEED